MGWIYSDSEYSTTRRGSCRSQQVGPDYILKDGLSSLNLNIYHLSSTFFCCLLRWPLLSMTLFNVHKLGWSISRCPTMLYHFILLFLLLLSLCLSIFCPCQWELSKFAICLWSLMSFFPILIYLIRHLI